MRILELEEAKIIFRNFAGSVNKWGSRARMFSVIIEDEAVAKELFEDGWNIKLLRKQDELDPDRWHLPVEIRYNGRTIPIQTVNKKRQILAEITEETVHQLDDADIVYADVVINGSKWDDGGVPKTKAYLRSMFVTLEDRPFADKYTSMIVDDDDTPF